MRWHIANNGWLITYIYAHKFLIYKKKGGSNVKGYNIITQIKHKNIPIWNNHVKFWFNEIERAGKWGNLSSLLATQAAINSK